MKKIAHPSDPGTGTKMVKHRAGPYDIPHRGQMDGGKDLSKDATNSMGKISKTEMHSPGPKARSHLK